MPRALFLGFEDPPPYLQWKAVQFLLIAADGNLCPPANCANFFNQILAR